MEIKKEIIWTENAQRRYINILSYLDENWSTKEFTKFEKTVKKTLNMLSNNPYIGRTDERYIHLRKIFIGYHTYIYYQVTEEYIRIMTLWDTRQNPNSLII